MSKYHPMNISMGSIGLTHYLKKGKEVIADELTAVYVYSNEFQGSTVTDPHKKRACITIRIISLTTGRTQFVSMPISDLRKSRIANVKGTHVHNETGHRVYRYFIGDTELGKDYRAYINKLVNNGDFVIKTPVTRATMTA